MDEKFLPKISFKGPPMTLRSFSEGVWLAGNAVAFDIETFSPYGFPAKAQDPVVNFSLVVPLIRKGILCLSVIGEPSLEEKLLYMFKEWFLGFRGAHLLTYNGAKFDLNYIARRGSGEKRKRR